MIILLTRTNGDQIGVNPVNIVTVSELRDQDDPKAVTGSVLELTNGSTLCVREMLTGVLRQSNQAQ